MFRMNRFFWLSLFVLNFLVVILSLSFFYPRGMFTYFNSDTLYAPLIFRGIFMDGAGLEGWHLNAAPNFFPDFFFYSLINALIPNFKWAMIVFSSLQYAGIMALLSWLMLRIKQNLPPVFIVFANLLMLLFLGVAITGVDYYFTYQLISISYHMGPFILTISSLILLSYHFEHPANKKYFNLLLIIIFLGVLNNRLYLVMFTIPGLLAMVLFYKKKKMLVRRFLIGAFLSGLSGVAGFWAIKQSGYVSITGTDWKMMNFDNIQNSAEIWFSQLMTFFHPLDLRGIIFILSVVAYFFMLKFATRTIRNILTSNTTEPNFEDFYVLFFCIFAPALLLLPVLNGAYVGPAIIRYNIHVYYLAIFNWGYLLFKFFEHMDWKSQKIPNRISIIILSLFFAIIIVGFYAKRDDFKAFIQYKPGYVNCVDEFAKKHNIHYGTGSYWFSKTTTMFSDEGVRMYHLYGNFRTRHHSLNENWFYGTGKGEYSNPEFGFVVISDSSSDSINIRKLLADPLLTEQCNNLRILKYPEYKFDLQSRLPYLIENETKQSSNLNPNTKDEANHQK